MLTSNLSNIIVDGQKLSPRQSALKRFDIFFKRYKTAFDADSGFKRWKSTLAPFILGSSNTQAVSIFALHVLRLLDNTSGETSKAEDSPPKQTVVGTRSPKGIHAEFEYSAWKPFIEDEC